MRSLFFFSLGGMETSSSPAGAPRLLPASCRLFFVKEPAVSGLGSFSPLQGERWCEGWSRTSTVQGGGWVARGWAGEGAVQSRGARCRNHPRASAEARVASRRHPRLLLAWLRRRRRAAMGTAHLHVPKGSRAESGQLVFGGKLLPATCT